MNTNNDIMLKNLLEIGCDANKKSKGLKESLSAAKCVVFTKILPTKY